MMKVPKNLKEVQKILKNTLNTDLFDKNWTWEYIHHLQRLRSSFKGNFLVTKKEKLKLLYHAQSLLAPLGCKKLYPRWTNMGYCPPGPHGKYVWSFQCAIVQECLWLLPELVDGYRFGLKPKEPYRDANPHFEPSRALSWDSGYVLGANSKKLTAWCNEKTEIYSND